MRRCLPVLLLALLCLLARPGSAQAEGMAETEARLKGVGIDEAMRLEIHEAIRKGVAVLRRVQFKNGSVLGHSGQTVLAGLAMAHAGIPEAEKGAHAAVAYILKYGQKAARGRTYQAGLVCMLIHSLEAKGRAQRFLLEVHGRLRRGPQSDAGYWGYRSGGGKGPSNLSTAQFAALGLWAAERAGAKPATKAWQLHLDALLKAQTPWGSWGYYAPGADQVGVSRGPYPTGTFMGLANLALAREALKERIAGDPEYDARVHMAVALGRAALRRDTLRTLSAPGLHGALGHYPYYRLYALEKACIFLDIEQVGGLEWYREGARQLLDRQLPKTGGWAMGLPPASARLRKGTVMQPNAQHTAFALLFLLRASAAYHPVTPRPVARPKVTTPRAEDEPEDDGEPGATAPPLMLAKGVIDRLEKALAGQRLRDLRGVARSLRLARRVYRSSRTKDGFVSPGHELWARRLDDLVLKLAVRFRTAKANDRLLWQAVSLEALKTLGQLHPRVGPRLMKAVLGMENNKTFREEFRLGWYGTALESLRHLGPPGLATWMSARLVSDDPHRWWRSSAALTTLACLAPTVSGRGRHGIARAVWRHINDLTRRSAGNWQAADLMRDLQVLMYRLAAAGDHEDLPELGALDPASAVKRMQGWWKRHDKPDDAMWR